jgi:hypothetical protein
MVYSMSKVNVIFGIILYNYNNIIDKYLLGKNAWKVDDERLMFVLKIWVYRHDNTLVVMKIL